MKKFFLIFTIFALLFSACKSEKDVEIARLEGEIKVLNERVSHLQGLLNECQSKLGGSAPVRASAPAETARPRTPATPTTPPPTNREVARSTPSASPSIADLSGLRDHNGNFIFCIMVNNDPALHFPQYAIDNGVRFPSLEGGNWKVSPTEYMEGDYGLTRDGMFFVSNSLLKNVVKKDINNVKIKTTFESWRGTDMSLVGDFWTIKGQ